MNDDHKDIINKITYSANRSDIHNGNKETYRHRKSKG